MPLPGSRSTTRHRHRMRCRVTTCRARFTLRKAPELYVHQVRCPVCRSGNVRSVEAERRRELAARDTCWCRQYPFPHERGTLVMCPFHPDRLAGLAPTEEEQLQHEKTLGRSRTAWSFGGDEPTAEQQLAAVPF